MMKTSKLIFLLSITWLTGCSFPPSNINTDASVSTEDRLPENPLAEKAITSSINPAKGTMSTLYGNQTAYVYAGANRDKQYRKGSILFEVTWKQKADSLWFGANIPREILSVERVLFPEKGKPVYELYIGNPLRKKAEPVQSEERLAFILSENMAPSP
ncbi:hypothetical protein [Sinomicrobium sp. M5D2P9]